MKKFILIDTFNSLEISWHKSLRGATRAKLRHALRIRRNCGHGAYIPTKIIVEEGGIPRPLTDEEYDMSLDMYNENFTS